MTRADVAARPFVLYLRSRHVAEALAAAAGSTALLWAATAGLDDPTVALVLGPAAVGTAAAVAGHGLAGADVGLERTAAIDWRPRRAAHVVLVVATALAVVATTALTDHQLGPLAEMARNAVGTGGVLALAATTLGAARSWIPAALWAPAAQHILHQSSPTGPLYAQILTWPAQPAASSPAAITAVVLGVAGTAAYAVLGPRP